MGTVSDDLLKIARRCADKLTLSRRGSLPALEDLDSECEDGIEEMLALLQDEDVFGEVDLNAQQKLVDQIEAALPEDRRALIGELAEQHMKHVWLQQEAAYHLGLAVGMKFAGQAPNADQNIEDDFEDGDETEEEE
jgi:hypothetical protein